MKAGEAIYKLHELDKYNFTYIGTVSEYEEVLQIGIRSQPTGVGYRYLVPHRAIPLYELTVRIAEEVLGFDHPNTKAFQGNLRSFREKLEIENVEVRRVVWEWLLTL